MPFRLQPLPLVHLLSIEPSSQRLCSLAELLENLVCGGRDDGFHPALPTSFPRNQTSRTQSCEACPAHMQSALEFPRIQPEGMRYCSGLLPRAYIPTSAFEPLTLIQLPSFTPGELHHGPRPGPAPLSVGMRDQAESLVFVTHSGRGIHP